MARSYLPGWIGPHFVVPEARGLKWLYLNLFGVPDIRVHLTAAHTIRELASISFKSMLDIGCGNGVITCWLASHYRNCSVVGIDRDQSALVFAEALAKQNGLAKVRFRNADVEADGLSEVFDLVTCFGVFQFIKDCDRMVRRINRVLALGGHLLLQLPSANRVEYLMRAETLRKRYPDFHEARGPFTAGEGLRLVTENGFELVRMTEAIKGLSVLAKELFYLSLSLSRRVNYACCPFLNWITAFDYRYSGPGNGLFLLARKFRD